MVDSTKELATTLKRLLEDKSITKAELSRKTGISRANLDQYLKGKTSPTLETLDRIAAALKMEPSDIIIGKSQVTTPAHKLTDCIDAISQAIIESKQNLNPQSQIQNEQTLNNNDNITSLLSALNDGKRMQAIAFLRGLAGLPPTASVREKKA